MAGHNKVSIWETKTGKRLRVFAVDARELLRDPEYYVSTPKQCQIKAEQEQPEVVAPIEEAQRLAAEEAELTAARNLELGELNKDALQEFADKLGIEGFKSMNKDMLVQAILEAETKMTPAED